MCFIISDVPDGNIITIAIRKTIISREVDLDLSILYFAIEFLAFGSVTGKSKIRELVFYDGYALILVKGNILYKWHWARLFVALI